MSFCAKLRNSWICHQSEKIEFKPNNAEKYQTRIQLNPYVNIFFQSHFQKTLLWRLNLLFGTKSNCWTQHEVKEQ